MRFAVCAFIALTISVSVASAASTQVRLAFGDDGTREATARTTFQLGGAALFSGQIEIGVLENTENTATYASAGLTFGPASVDVGRPRSVLDIPRLAMGSGIAPNTRRARFQTLAGGAALDGELGAGVRLLTESGPFRIGTSIHGHRTTDEAIVGVVGEYSFDTLLGLAEITVYGGAETDGAEERYRLGTAWTRGRATASVDLLSDGQPDGVSVSQLAVSVDLTQAFRLGVSGTREDTSGVSDPTNRLGIGAEFSTEQGVYLRGGLDGADSDDMAFDVSIGFEF
ncbi:MAG: hypothetical protein OXQ92_08080 [Boseongicola sp.]|nr:hypothetical protein [Boseongicola sp.]